MLKKTIKYTDLDGNPAEIDAYFNLTKAEAIELNIRNDLEVVGRAKNQNEIMDTFHRILRMAYGVKTGDGRFIKVNPQGAPLYYEFQSTEAYSELFLEIFANADYALEFIKAILPAEFDVTAQENQAKIPDALKDHPSMQGYKQAQTPVLQEPPKVLYKTPEFETEQELAEFEEFKRQKAERSASYGTPLQAPIPPHPSYTERAEAAAASTPPDQVSLPEVPQTAVPPRDELI